MRHETAAADETTRRLPPTTREACRAILLSLPPGAPETLLFRLPGAVGWATIKRLADTDAGAVYAFFTLAHAQTIHATEDHAVSLIVDGGWHPEGLHGT